MFRCESARLHNRWQAEVWVGLAEIAFGDSRAIVALPADCDEAWLRATLPLFRYRLVRRRLGASAHPQWLHLSGKYFSLFLDWLYFEASTVRFIGGEGVVDMLADYHRSEFTLE